MRLSRWIGVASVAAALSFASNARADGDPVVVLDVQSPDAFDQAGELTKALQFAMRTTPGRTLDEHNFTVDALMVTLACTGSDGLPGEVPPDAACQDKIPDQIKQDRYVWARLTKDGENLKGTIYFYQKGKPTASADISYPANLTFIPPQTQGDEATVAQLVSKARDALSRAGAGAPTAHFRLNAGSENGEVFLGDKSLGKLNDGKGMYEAPAGDQTIMVKLADGRSMTGTVTVKADGSAELTITPPPPIGKGLDAKIPIGFGLMGVGVGFAVAGIYSSVQIPTIQDSFNTNWKPYVPSGKDACSDPSARDAAATKKGADVSDLQSLCDRSAKHTTLQEAFYPVAAAAGITGVILVAVSDWKGKPAAAKTGKTGGVTGLTVVPVVSPDGGYVSVGGGF